MKSRKDPIRSSKLEINSSSTPNPLLLLSQPQSIPSGIPLSRIVLVFPINVVSSIGSVVFMYAINNAIMSPPMSLLSSFFSWRSSGRLLQAPPCRLDFLWKTSSTSWWISSISYDGSESLSRGSNGKGWVTALLSKFRIYRDKVFHALATAMTISHRHRCKFL